MKESFVAWLYERLVDDEVIDPVDFADPENLTEDELITSTELDYSDLENYIDEFRERCVSQGVEPDWDLPE